jgi:ATP-binding protein involved in chromosome partitioning
MASSNPPVPAALKGDREGLQITWSDGAVHRLLWKTIRTHCPCATCRVKRNEPPPLFNILKPEDTVEIRATRMEPIGNYAYHIDFTDNHTSGIYSFELLRDLGQRFSTPK